ncbi:MAG: NAD-dependent epimerase/dehydratase family protein, partial [Candidatus Freyarchaeota archaeon]
MWDSRNVLVTGGASFIGSHLVDSLLKKGAIVKVADDFSSGKLSNLEYPLKKVASNTWTHNSLTVIQGDLKDKSFTKNVLKDVEVVFHLAALHGGRGYIHTHPAQCCTNMILDQLVFEEAQKAGVDRICFASSACVYPAYLQEQTGSNYLLREEDADPFVRDKAFADLEYGWAKLMGEMALKAYHRQYGMKTSSVRIFTAYGPRENETHAIIALIAKAFIR